jgi:hypothetical protein
MTINDMGNTDSISLLFKGRDYINWLGGEHKFKEELAKNVINDKQAANALVDIMVKTPPSSYVYFTYKRQSGRNTEGIRFYYKVNNPATTKLYIYRKNAADPLVNNYLQKCYVIVEYKRKRRAKLLAISAVEHENDIDTSNGACVDAFDGHHIA